MQCVENSAYSFTLKLFTVEIVILLCAKVMYIDDLNNNKWMYGIYSTYGMYYFIIHYSLGKLFEFDGIKFLKGLH